MRPINFRHIAESDSVGYLACRLPSNFRDFTWSKFSGHNLLSLVLKDRKLFLSLAGRVPLTSGNIPQESTVRASKGRALQLAHGLDFLSIQAYRLWMEYPSRGKMKFGYDDLLLYSDHTSGGNAYGKDADRGVVDAGGRLFGSENVYVADSSLFPTASGINPSWTIMALSHRVSSQLAKSLG